MTILTIEGKRFSGLAEALYDNYDFVKDLYPYDFLLEEDWNQRIAWLDANPGADRREMSAALMTLNQRLGCGEKTLESLRALAGDSALAVVTGQQTGLFTGPLYTLYKAATTIKRAQRLSASTGRPVVPVFWMATEDHDYAEIAMNWHFDGTQVKGVRLSRTHKTHSPVGMLPVSEELKTLCNEVCATLGDLSYGREMAELLETTLEKSHTLGEWFGRLLLDLFAPWGLVVLDPSAPDMRRVMEPFFRQCLVKTTAIQQAFSRSSEKVTEMGFRKEMELGQGQTGIFLIEEGNRIPLYANEDGTLFTDRDGQMSWTLETLLDRLERKPEDFSTGAALRPALQDWLLPVAAAILGPSETAYHAQLGDIFTTLGRRLPIIVPRESWTLAPDEGHIDFKDVTELLQGSPEAWVSDRIMDLADPEMRNRITQYNEEYQSHIAQLIDSLPVSSEARERLSQGAHHMQEREMKWLYKSMRRYLTAEADEYRTYRSFARMLRPLGRVQERTLLPWYFLSVFGRELIGSLTESEFSTDMRILTGGRRI